MIRIYDSQARDFSHNGLGSLDEALSAVVGEELNGSYEMEMEYPISGRHFDKIQLRNIIFCKPNPHNSEQPFRIYSITKPLNGVVVISAEHISYDTSGVIILPKRKTTTNTYIRDGVEPSHAADWLSLSEGGVALTPDSELIYIIKTANDYENLLYIWDSEGPFYTRVDDSVLHEIHSYGVKDHKDDKDGYFLETILTEINNSGALQSRNYFELEAHESKEADFKEEGYSIPMPMSLRAMLGGSDASLLTVFEGEFIFDKFLITLTEKRGINRGITIRHGKNLTEMEQESDGSNLFTGVFPFYSKNYTETRTSMDLIYQPCYIREGVNPLRGDWLSTKTIDPANGIGGIAIPPVVETISVIIGEFNTVIEKLVAMQIKTPGEYLDKIYAYKESTLANDLVVLAYVKEKETIIVETIIEEETIETSVEIPLSLTSDADLLVDIDPDYGIIYLIKTDTPGLYNNKYIYENVDGVDKFVKYDDDGFYIECTDINTLNDEQQEALPSILPPWKIKYSPLTTPKWTEDTEDDGGIRVVRPLRPNIGTVSVDKFVYLDLLSPEIFVPEPESTSILEDGIIYVNQTLKDLPVQRILPLDLTSVLDAIGGLTPEQMTQTHLFNKVEKHMEDNDYTSIKESIDISFLKLSGSPEYEHLKELEVVELGDEVTVIYEKLGVDTIHRVISTEYNVLSDEYTEIELGDKKEKITNTIVTTGDNLSSLKNDVDYASKEYITKLVADNAQIINVEIQNAMIQNLEAVSADISGSLKASIATIDALIARLFTTDYAEVAKALIAGTVRVKGDLTLDSGSITINRTIVGAPINVYVLDGADLYGLNWLSEDNIDPIDVMVIETGTVFKVVSEGLWLDKCYKWNAILGYYVLVSTYVFSVDRDGNVIANNLIITGGSLDIGDNFRVTNEGILTARGVKVIDGEISITADGVERFAVSKSGGVKASSMIVDNLYADNIFPTKVKAKDVITDRLYLSADKKVYMERVTGDNFVEQTVTLTGDLFGVELLEDNITWHGYMRAEASVPVFEDKLCEIVLMYTNGVGDIDFMLRSVTISKGSTLSNTEEFSIIAPLPLGGIVRANTVPTSYDETKIDGEVYSIIINANGTEYDIITGIEAAVSPLDIPVQEDEPDLEEYEGNIWFRVET